MVPALGLRRGCVEIHLTRNPVRENAYDSYVILPISCPDGPAKIRAAPGKARFGGQHLPGLSDA